MCLTLSLSPPLGQVEFQGLTVFHTHTHTPLAAWHNVASTRPSARSSAEEDAESSAARFSASHQPLRKSCALRQIRTATISAAFGRQRQLSQTGSGNLQQTDTRRTGPTASMQPGSARPGVTFSVQIFYPSREREPKCSSDDPSLSRGSLPTPQVEFPFFDAIHQTLRLSSFCKTSRLERTRVPEINSTKTHG